MRGSSRHNPRRAQAGAAQAPTETLPRGASVPLGRETCSRNGAAPSHSASVPVSWRASSARRWRPRRTTTATRPPSAPATGSDRACGRGARAR